MSGYFNFGKYKKSLDSAIDAQSKGKKVEGGTAGNPGGKKKKKKKSTY
jgi:hypothetical protein